MTFKMEICCQKLCAHDNFFYGSKSVKIKPLSEILDIKKLMNVDKPIETANGLPNECYTSEQYLEL